MSTVQQNSNTDASAFLDRVWNDAAFAARLENNPQAALKEYFGDMPDGVELRVVRDTAAVKHLHIPAAPVEGAVDDHDLMGAQGGTTNQCIPILTCIGLTFPQVTVPTDPAPHGS